MIMIISKPQLFIKIKFYIFRTPDTFTRKSIRES